MRTIFFLLLAFLIAPLQGAYFGKPPPGWQCIEEGDQLPANVLVLYIGKGSTRFAPTIHVASDPLSQSLDEYVGSALHYHQRNRGAMCSDLGQILTQSGTARILRIDSPSVYGEVSLLQAYLSTNNKVYVVTGISLKEDFKDFSPLFYQTVQTFHVEKSVAAEKQSD